MVPLGKLWNPEGLSPRQVRHARLKLVGAATLWLALAAVAVVALAGCGQEEEPADNAVEATEQNTVRLGGIDYRVIRFRQLNPRITPDRSIVSGQPPAEGRAYYAAFMSACNPGGSTRTPTSSIHLEDAFGQRFAPLSGLSDTVFAYRARPLKPGACLPTEGSAADRAVDGAALVFEVPIAAARERPLILELSRRPDGSGRAAGRVQLDL
jgi:hypothetical protein